MSADPMRKDEQAVLFNQVLKNQIAIMGILHENQSQISMAANLPEAIRQSKDVRRFVSYVDAI